MGDSKEIVTFPFFDCPHLWKSHKKRHYILLSIIFEKSISDDQKHILTPKNGKYESNVPFWIFVVFGS